MSFVHLHVHSCFSFLDGAARVEDLVARAVELGLPALALTDHNGLYGAVRFYKAACSASIKPLLGSEIDVQGGHLLLLAKDKEGYSNLCRLLTILHLSRNGGSPALELDHLSAHSSGLICLSGCEKGEVPSLLRAGKVKAALEAASRLKDIFGDHFFVELQNHLLPHSSSLNYHLSQLAHHLGLPLVATNNVHYLKAEDYPLHELLISIRKIERVGQSKPPRLNAEYYLKSPAQMQRLFRNYPQALANSLLLSQECSLELGLKKPRLPHFELARGEEPFGYLCRLCWQQAQEIYGSISSELKGRLEKELKAVKELGLASYFLIVWDLVSFAQKRGISYSGRGSAAGSLICYLLGITKVDPLAQGLLFERFLNENRKELPDIDVDFSSARREVVLTYLYQKYGKEQVAMVATLITYRAKNALRDVGKTLGLDKESLDHLAKALPYISAERIPQAVESLPELDPKEFSSPKVRQAVALAGRLSGFPRHLGTHLGGVVISPEPLTDIVPLERNAQGLVVCQMDKDDLQELGLLKLDVLGLRMLASLEEAG
ncbi:DNA polymerase III subunit alpha, partial [Candidatus Hakubella thermalkaliphila]